MTSGARAGLTVRGIGVVSPGGDGAGALWHVLRSGAAEPATISHFDTSGAHVRTALTVPGEQRAQGHPDRTLDLLVRASQQALLAGCPAGGDVALIVASTQTVGNGFSAAAATSARDGWLALGPALVDQAASALGLDGPSCFVSSASASGAVALGLARDMISAGEAGAALVAAADVIVSTAFMGLDSLRILSPQGCRPFSSERAGIAVSEAGCALLVEPARPAHPGYATVTGYGCSNFGQHPTASSTEAIARAVRLALADAGLAPGDVDFVNAHGTGTRQGDAAEVEALRQVFGPDFPGLAVLSSKGAIGHSQGVAGLIEALATILSVWHRTLPVSQASEPADPAWPDLDLVLSERPVPRLRRGVSVSCGLGGVHTALVIEAAGEAP